MHGVCNRVVEGMPPRLPAAFWPRHTAGKALQVLRSDSRTLFPRCKASLPADTPSQGRPLLRRAVQYSKAPPVQKHRLLPTLAIYKKNAAVSLVRRFGANGLPSKPVRHDER